MFGWRNSRFSNALSMVELLVDIDCKGCEKKIRRALFKLDGVETVEIDAERQKVTVTGYVERRDVLKAVRRTGRSVEFWPFPYGSVVEYSYPYASDQNSMNSHSSVVDDKTLYLFSDDNVHACSLM